MINGIGSSKQMGEDIELRIVELEDRNEHLEK